MFFCINETKSNFIMVPRELTRDTNLKASDLRIIIAIIDSMGQCASNGYIAQNTGLTARQVINRVNILVKAGYLKKIGRRKIGGKLVNQYQIFARRNEDPTSENISPEENPLVKNLHPTSENISHQLVKKFHPIKNKPNNKLKNKGNYYLNKIRDSEITKPRGGPTTKSIGQTMRSLISELDLKD